MAFDAPSEFDRPDTSGRVGEAKWRQAIKSMSAQSDVQLRPRKTQASRRLRLVAVRLLQHLQDLSRSTAPRSVSWMSAHRSL